ncbi:C40 family peptidase [Kutzneria buriramensis]|uniref:Cell wall-associated NlpC family hydrolase n=1 Tax=Kutzneria buriramensis TaxID=1045776 RepID=A0A3E0I6U4_9PSEU|nr:C40 family peptidase [Kutzneria buriramensis]REH54474.1 cell wall-associated NlpC family hydrolase [Kutzneria buriramensis]
MKIPYKHVLGALGVTLAVISLAPASALADPPTNANDALAQLHDASQKEESVGEQYNAAQSAYQARLADVQKANADLATDQQAEKQAKADEDRYRGDVDRWVSATTEGADLSSMSALLTGQSPSDFLDRAWMLQEVSQFNGDAMAGLDKALSKASDASKKAQQAQDKSNTAAAQAKQVADGLQAQKDAATQAEQAAQAAYNRLTGSQKTALASDKGQPFDTSNVPPGAAGIAVKAALGQVGTPYVYGGNQPGVGLDCSSLVQYAYRQAGISLPRVTTDQVNVGTPVSEADLKPGDLLFFGTASNVHHVAMFIGNGQIVHAPDVGQVVKVVPISGGGSDYYTSRRIVNS